MNSITCTHCGTANQSGARFCKACGHELPKTQTVITSFEPLAPSKAESRRKNMIGVIVGVVGLAVILTVGYFVMQGPLKEGILAGMAEKTNQSCPMMLDNETRLDNVEALSGNSLQYNYTLVNIDRGEINTDALMKALEPNILENIKSNQEMNLIRKMKTTLIYHYSDKNGEYIHQYTVTPDMYE